MTSTFASFFHKAHFVTSAPATRLLPEDDGYEVAFLGRSNAGKSSCINALTQQKSLAKTSSVPGKTAMLNVFQLDPERRIIDVPGFGYAKVSQKARASWRQLINQYLSERTCLRGVVVLMDIRHPLKEQDLHLIEWLQHTDLAVHVLLTKADKLSKSERQKTYFSVKKALPAHFSLTIFSVKDKLGVDTLTDFLGVLYDL